MFLLIVICFLEKFSYIVNFPVTIQYERKYFCTTNITTLKVDPNFILDIKERFNNNIDQANSYILDEFEYIKTNVDYDSGPILQHVFSSLLCSLNCDNIVYKRNDVLQDNKKSIKEEIGEARKKYKVSSYSQTVFWAKHGLEFANPKILKYIKNRDILDVGAFNGDSLLVLKDYTKKTVYSYEYSPANLHLIDEAISDNRVNETNIQIIPVAISNETKQMKTDFDMSEYSQIREKNNGLDINITTIDSERKRLNMKVGFLKINIVGMEFLALEGAKETIKNDRPVISVAIYYNFDDLFRIRRLIDQFPNYTFLYRFGSWYSGSFGELFLFAHPESLIWTSDDAYK